MPARIQFAGVHESEDDALSHITKIRTRMAEKQYLLYALQDLGHTVENRTLEVDGESVTVLTPFNRPKVVLHKEDGIYIASVKSFFGFVSSGTKSFLQDLTQRYIFHVAVSTMKEYGFSIESQELEENERVRLMLRRVAF